MNMFRLTAFAWMVSASTFASTAHADYVLSTKSTGAPSLQMAHNSGIVDCKPLQAAYDASGLPRGDSMKVIRLIDAYAKRRLRYSADPRSSESWDSLAGEMLAGVRSVKGDCDDLALTVIALAICAGVPADRLDFATAQTSRGSLSLRKMDHAVAIYTDQSGRAHVFGDTMKKPRALSGRDRVILKVSAAEIARKHRMTWRSTVELLARR